jgi:DNA-directed RNA polymerase subunit RPC12/RpoP
MDPTYCDRCGDELGPSPELTHEACRESRKLEPPRYCPECRRRLIVQVVPNHWKAHCSAHGPVL